MPFCVVLKVCDEGTLQFGNINMLGYFFLIYVKVIVSKDATKGSGTAELIPLFYKRDREYYLMIISLLRSFRRITKSIAMSKTAITKPKSPPAKTLSEAFANI